MRVRQHGKLAGGVLRRLGCQISGPAFFKDVYCLSETAFVQSQIGATRRGERGPQRAEIRELVVGFGGFSKLPLSELGFSQSVVAYLEGWIELNCHQCLALPTLEIPGVRTEKGGIDPLQHAFGSNLDRSSRRLDGLGNVAQAKIATGEIALCHVVGWILLQQLAAFFDTFLPVTGP